MRIFADAYSLDVSPTDEREEFIAPIGIDVVTPSDNEVIALSAYDVPPSNDDNSSILNVSENTQSRVDDNVVIMKKIEV